MPKTYATWTDTLMSAVSSVPVYGGWRGGMIFGLWA
jgi:hypothetical protein